ncbi:hypothetical protein BJX68DRAFT_14329 [Aspergillus pseudodeflectus]|uniref:Uncharacterized protein n=1 Tax=Aspergillus pseudodeflectus TaxID=176178 RepID=A0ABR4LC96_9EURO
MLVACSQRALGYSEVACASRASDSPNAELVTGISSRFAIYSLTEARNEGASGMVITGRGTARLSNKLPNDQRLVFNLALALERRSRTYSTCNASSALRLYFSLALENASSDRRNAIAFLGHDDESEAANSLKRRIRLRFWYASREDGVRRSSCRGSLSASWTNVKSLTCCRDTSRDPVTKVVHKYSKNCSLTFNALRRSYQNWPNDFPDRIAP